MAKKKNPEQEAPPAEPQEETPQEETPVEGTREPEEQPREQDPQEEAVEEPAEEPGEEDPDQDPEEDPREESEEEPAQQPPANETEQLRSQLLQAQGRLAAYAAGVNPSMVDDAVTLAMAEAAKTGTVTESSVTAAMEAVLKRHPEWKAEDGKKKTAGGFKLGADRDNGGVQKKPGAPQNLKRWNRFK